MAFIALRFGVGLFFGGMIPTALRVDRTIFPKEQRGLVYGISYSASFLGQFLGPALGGLLASRFGIPAVFIAVGSVMLLNLLWVARVPAKHRSA